MSRVSIYSAKLLLSFFEGYIYLIFIFFLNINAIAHDFFNVVSMVYHFSKNIIEQDVGSN